MPLARATEQAPLAAVHAAQRRHLPKRFGAAAVFASVAVVASFSPLSFAALTGRLVASRSSCAHRAPTLRRAEAFDPFGWKGQLKGLVEGITIEEPSQLEEKMMLEIFEKFDQDKDGVLNLSEFNRLQTATEGPDAVYDGEQLKSLLLIVNPEIESPEKGMPFEDYRRLYIEKRLRMTYGTDVTRDHVKVFGSDGGVAAEAADSADATGAAGARAQGGEGRLAEGTPVTIEGLTSVQELNGSSGHVVAPNDDEASLVAEGRLIVKLADGERLALKPANIKVSS